MRQSSFTDHRLVAALPLPGAKVLVLQAVKLNGTPCHDLRVHAVDRTGQHPTKSGFIVADATWPAVAAFLREHAQAEPAAPDAKIG